MSEKNTNSSEKQEIEPRGFFEYNTGPLRKKLKKVGSWALVASMALGVGNFNIATVSGAQYGANLLWVFWLGALCYFFLLEGSTRIYLNRGLTPARLFKKIHKGSSVFLFFYVAFAAAATLSFELAFFGLIGSLFGFSYQLTAIIGGLATLSLLLFGVYSSVEKIFNVLMILIIFVIVATAVAIGWPFLPDFWTNFATPSVQGKMVPMMMSIISTTVSAVFFLGYPYFMMEKDWTPQNFSSFKEKVKVLGWSRTDLGIGASLGALLAIPMTAIVAKIVYPLGIKMSSGVDLMMILEPLLGEWSKYVWSLGIIVAAFTSAVGMMVLASYVTLDTFELDPKLGTRNSKIVVTIFLFAAIPIALLNINPIFLTLFVSAFRLLFFPAVAIVMLYALNKPEYAGAFRNKKLGLGNLIGAIVVGVLITLALTGALDLLHTTF